MMEERVVRERGCNEKWSKPGWNRDWTTSIIKGGRGPEKGAGFVKGRVILNNGENHKEASFAGGRIQRIMGLA